MVKKVVKADFSQGIRKEYNEFEGTWHVQVFTQGTWISVAIHCEEDEAEDCINDLCRWKRGE